MNRKSDGKSGGPVSAVLDMDTPPQPTQAALLKKLDGLPPLRRARAEALLKWCGGYASWFTIGCYEELEKCGWDRASAEQAIDDLVAAGLAMIPPPTNCGRYCVMLSGFIRASACRLESRLRSGRRQSDEAQ